MRARSRPPSLQRQQPNSLIGQGGGCCPKSLARLSRLVFLDDELRRLLSDMLIDTTFDFRTESGPGRDPDAFSPTLRRYHKLLWSKALPDGRDFTLSDASWAQYLHHRSDLGEFRMTSDTIAATYTLRQNPAVRRILASFPEEDHAAFRAKAYTIAGFLIFPANTPGRTGRTINQDRGCDPRISDRIDLTLECIRRHYLGDPSPLASTLVPAFVEA